MGIYGDDVDDYFGVLHHQFDVDLATFPYPKYFPNEFEGGSYLRSYLATLVRDCLWFIKKETKGQYAPITLGMVEEVIEHRKWIFD